MVCRPPPWAETLCKTRIDSEYYVLCESKGYNGNKHVDVHALEWEFIPSIGPTQEEEISLFNKKKAAVQAQRAQTEREQLTKKQGHHKKWNQY